jgi:hypothetical protein
MRSRIISTISFDEDALAKDIARILQIGNVKEEYSEYRFGTWKNYVLWNGTGSQKDTLFRGPQGGSLRTELGRQLPYINAILEENFDTAKVKMVRANLLQDALLIPHRDYVEFKEDSERLLRLHIPVQTNPQALHSEHEHVFHMRKGEVWLLSVERLHSACNPSETPRVSIVIDFCAEGAEPESLLRHPQPSGEHLQPMLIDREPVDEEFLRSIASLKHVVNQTNYKDMVMFLSRVHFYKDVDASRFFDWLIEICRDSGDAGLWEKSVRYKDYLVNGRELEERFPL